ETVGQPGTVQTVETGLEGAQGLAARRLLQPLDQLGDGVELGCRVPEIFGAERLDGIGKARRVLAAARLRVPSLNPFHGRLPGSPRSNRSAKAPKTRKPSLMNVSRTATAC